MSDAVQREWRFYLDNMIRIAGFIESQGASLATFPGGQ